MEKDCCQVRITETEDGFRIDVTGKDLKKAFACCFAGDAGDKKQTWSCCPSDEKEGE